MVAWVNDRAKRLAGKARISNPFGDPLDFEFRAGFRTGTWTSLNDSQRAQLARLLSATVVNTAAKARTAVGSNAVPLAC